MRCSIAHLTGVAIPCFQKFHHRVAPFRYSLAEEEAGQNRRDEHGKYQRAEERKRHRPGHGLEQASLHPLQRENGQIRRDDDGDRVEDGPLDFMRGLRGSTSHRFRGICFLPLGQVANDVFNHHHRAIHDHSEIQRAKGEQVCGNTLQIQTCRGKQECKWDRKRDDDRSPDISEK